MTHPTPGASPTTQAADRAAGPADEWLLRPWQADDGQALCDALGHALPAPAANEPCWVLCARSDPQQAALASLRLARSLGHRLPRFGYHVGQAVHAAAELHLHQRQRTLLLGNDLTGADELCGFGWRADAPPPPAAPWQVLVQAALQAWAADQPPATALVAELPGLRDAQGQSPFWHGLGRHFYPRDPQAAWAEHGPAWRSHVGALLPRQLLYASFLGAEAQAAIAAAHPAVQGLVQALHEAGFAWRGQIAVDDGGPVLQR